MSEKLSAEEMAPKMEELAKPFPPACISHLPKGGVTLSYVGHANITARLNSVDPLWTWQPFAVDERGLPSLDINSAGQPVGMWILLTVLGKTIPAYGSCLGNKQEAIKELIGDALRNGAMRFGVALDLWAKNELEGSEGEQAAQQRPPQAAQRAAAPQQRANGQNGGIQPHGGISPIQQLCAFADSIGVENAVPAHMLNILKAEGADFQAVTAGNLALAKNFVQQHIEGKLPPNLLEDDDPFADREGA